MYTLFRRMFRPIELKRLGLLAWQVASDSRAVEDAVSKIGWHVYG